MDTLHDAGAIPWGAMKVFFCQRCGHKRIATHRVTSDIIDVYVCVLCAEEVPLGGGAGEMKVEPIGIEGR